MKSDITDSYNNVKEAEYVSHKLDNPRKTRGLTLS